MFKKQARKITQRHKLALGVENIDVVVTLTRRRSMSIIVRPDMQVEVKAPLRASIPRLLRQVEEKGYWILKHREKFRGRAGANKPKQYVEGELFGYLGNKYALKLVESKIAGIKLVDGFMEVHGRSKTASAIKAQLRFWYHEKAREIFEQRLPLCIKACEDLKLPQHKTVNIKKMKRKWGSCATDRTISLNPELVAAPLECVDYVIIHELCHLREHNHSPRYYKILTAAMPAWKAYKELLNKSVETDFI